MSGMISIIITIKPANHNYKTGMILTHMKIQNKKVQGWLLSTITASFLIRDSSEECFTVYILWNIQIMWYAAIKSISKTFNANNMLTLCQFQEHSYQCFGKSSTCKCKLYLHSHFSDVLKPWLLTYLFNNNGFGFKEIVYHSSSFYK